MDEAPTFDLGVAAIEVTERLLDADVLTLLLAGTDKSRVSFEINLDNLIRDWELFRWLLIELTSLREQIGHQCGVIDVDTRHRRLLNEIEDLIEDMVDLLLLVVM